MAAAKNADRGTLRFRQRFAHVTRPQCMREYARHVGQDVQKAFAQNGVDCFTYVKCHIGDHARFYALAMTARSGASAL